MMCGYCGRGSARQVRVEAVVSVRVGGPFVNEMMCFPCLREIVAERAWKNVHITVEPDWYTRLHPSDTLGIVVQEERHS